MPDRDPELAAMLRQFLETQKLNHVENKERGEAVKSVSAETLEDVKDIKRTLTTAFPNGDADAHRRYHEEMMREIEARRLFWQDLRTSLARYGVVGLTGFLITLLVAYFRSKTP